MKTLRSKIRETTLAHLEHLADALVSGAYFSGVSMSQMSSVKARHTDLSAALTKSLELDSADAEFYALEYARVLNRISRLMDDLELSLSEAVCSGDDIASVVKSFYESKVTPQVTEEFAVVRNRAFVKSFIAATGVLKSLGTSTVFFSVAGDPKHTVYSPAQVLRDRALLKGTLIPVPPGYAWIGNKLSCVDDRLFKSQLDNAGRKAAASAQRAGLGKNPPSMPGVPSVAQTGNGTSTPGLGGKPGPPAPPKSGGKKPSGVPCWYLPKSRSPQPPSTFDHETEKSWAIPRGTTVRTSLGEEVDETSVSPDYKGQDDPTPNYQPLPRPKTKDKEASLYEGSSKPWHVVRDHLANSEISDTKRIGDGSGVNASYMCSFQGNGRGVVKKAQNFVYVRSDGARGLQAGITSIRNDVGDQHESGAYYTFRTMGLHNHVPVTVRRQLKAGEFAPDAVNKNEVVNVSVQAAAEGYQSLANYLHKQLGIAATAKVADDLMRPEEVYVALMDSIPAEHMDHMKSKLQEIAVMQLMINNNDFHLDNMMVDADFSDVVCIDNTATCGYGMEGVRNDLMKGMHGAGERLEVPDHLMDRFQNTSYTDLLRGNKDPDTGKDILDEDSVAHNFLRMKYLHFLQEKEGFLDYEKFRYTSDLGDFASYHFVVDVGFDKDMGEALDRWQKGLTPNQLFNVFAKTWLETHANDPESPYHADAIRIRDLDTFMDVSDSYQDRDAYKKAGHSKAYYQKVTTGDPTQYMPADPSGGKDFGKYTGSSRGRFDTAQHKTLLKQGVAAGVREKMLRHIDKHALKQKQAKLGAVATSPALSSKPNLSSKLAQMRANRQTPQVSSQGLQAASQKLAAIKPTP